MCRVLAALAATLALTACGGSTAPPTPAPATVVVHGAVQTLDAVGATTPLSAIVSDAAGKPITNASVVWSSSSSGVASVSASGVVTAIANGTTNIVATAGSVHGQVTITVAQAPAAVIEISGDAQVAQIGHAEPEPLIVQVNDRLGHAVAGVEVRFAVTAGGGSVNPATDTTDAGGRAQTTWTVGSAEGANSATATASGVSSGAVTFAATSSANAPPLIDAIAPDTLVEGKPATITGSNFSATPAANIVTIDGAAATVTAATATSLTITVPPSACKPVRLASASVNVGGLVATRAGVPVEPASFTTLAVGEEAIVQDPSKFCVQLRASGAGEMYVMGLSAPAEQPGVVMPFTIAATAGLAASPSLAAGVRAPVATAASPTAFRLRPAPAAGGRPSPTLRTALARARTQMAADVQLREWERAHLPRFASRAAEPARAAAPRIDASVVPAVGDTLTIKVSSTQAGDLCRTFTAIRAVVRVVGTAGIWVEDVTNPTVGGLTLSDIQTASNQFDTKLFASDTTFFGVPTDIDGNGRVIIVLTWRVNQDARVAGFVFSGDLESASTCQDSNGGEYYYGDVPDPGNMAGSGARTKSDVLFQMPSLIAHEVTHVIQFGKRSSGSALAIWEAEGQATLAQELAGNAVLGNTSGENLGGDAVLGAAGSPWYGQEVAELAEYFGDDLSTDSRAANAPDLCTVYGNIDLTAIPCDFSAFYGASWMLQRYIGDQYGPSYPGGLAQLTRDWIKKNISLSGTPNIAALLGVNYDSLFVRFATALAIDDLDNGTGTAWIPPAFRITSWNSADLASQLASCCGLGWLDPPVMSFATTTTSRSVRGGSTAYAIVRSAAGHPATSFRFAGPGGGTLSAALRPAMWIVRVK